MAARVVVVVLPINRKLLLLPTTNRAEQSGEVLRLGKYNG